MNRDLAAGRPEKILWKVCLRQFAGLLFQQLYHIADWFVRAARRLAFTARSGMTGAQRPWRSGGRRNGTKAGE
ncbi:hypothetical protein D3Z50_07195 [Clostridiaceae bacterium]|nr:hypothetical protein [Clostridiaceae bacterium]